MGGSNRGVRAAGIVLAAVGAALALATAWPSADGTAGRHATGIDPMGELRQRQLAALGYVDFRPVPSDQAGRSGVVRLRPELAGPGYNLFNTRSSNRALLVTPDGTVAHAWHSPELEGTWHHVELAPGGDLLAIAKNGYLARLDWSSRVRWKREMAAHHDVVVEADGTIHVLDRAVREGQGALAGVEIWSDGVATLGPDGRTRRRIDLHDLLVEYVPERLERRALEVWADSEGRRPFDLFHVNALERIDRDLAGLPTTGAFLMTALTLDRVLIVDLERKAVLWSWGAGELDRPHHPSVLRNGHLLVFDNGAGRGWSRILEVDPAARRIVWEYGREPSERFFSKTRGGVQELPNGNLLVTESDAGRAFEVVRRGPHAGEIVWEFLNPDVVERDGEPARGTIYRLTRVGAEALGGRLASGAPGETPATAARDGAGSH